MPTLPLTVTAWEHYRIEDSLCNDEVRNIDHAFEAVTNQSYYKPLIHNICYTPPRVVRCKRHGELDSRAVIRESGHVTRQTRKGNFSNPPENELPQLMSGVRDNRQTQGQQRGLDVLHTILNKQVCASTVLWGG